MVSQTTVSLNSLITIALKWIMKYCKFFPKKDHLLLIEPITVPTWLPTERAQFSTCVINQSVLSSVGYTQNNHGENRFLKLIPQNKILD